MTIRKVPTARLIATPTATASRSPQGPTVPLETAPALIETAISAGSATVVEKPIAAAKR